MIKDIKKPLNETLNYLNALMAQEKKSLLQSKTTKKFLILAYDFPPYVLFDDIFFCMYWLI